MRASEVAFPSLSPLYPIPKPCYPNRATSRLRNLQSFLISDISSLISSAFLYRHCWVGPAPQANQGRTLQSVPIVSLTSLEGFPMGWGVMLVIFRAEMTDMASAQWMLKLQYQLHPFPQIFHNDKVSLRPHFPYPPVEYLTREIDFTHKQTSINKKWILSENVTKTKMIIIHNNNNMNSRTISWRWLWCWRKQ